jgi:signal transduction histidine kinase
MSVLEGLQLAVGVAFALVLAGAVRQWSRQRSPAAAWFVATFLTLTVFIAAGHLVPEPGEPGHTWGARLAVAALTFFPYCLVRLAWAIAQQRGARATAQVVTAVLLAAGMVLNPVGEDRTSAEDVYVIAFLGAWTLASLLAAYQLWREGRGSAVTRSRMRLLAVGVLVLNLSLIGTVIAGTDPVAAAVVQVTAIVSAVAFLVGFAPPATLRAMWRARVASDLGDEQLALVAASTPEEVGAAMATMVHRLLGTPVLVLDRHDQVLGADGTSEEEQQRVLSRVAADEDVPEATVREVAGGRLVVLAGPHAPLFEDDEYALLEVLRLQFQLALERAELHRREQQARARIEVSARELETIVYGLSHDLKTPVATLVGYAEILAMPEAELGEHDRARIAEAVRRSARYTTDLLDDLLEYSRVRELDSEVEPVDLGTVVDEVAATLVDEHPGLTVTRAPLPTVAIHPTRCRQLVQNLLSNAARHGGRPDITVEVAAIAHEDGSVTVSVADDGVGVPPAERSRVFELFERGTTSGARGSGIGLAMCRRIVEVTGGRIELASVPSGTRFEIELPAAAVVWSPPAQTPGTAAEHR